MPKIKKKELSEEEKRRKRHKRIVAGIGLAAGVASSLSPYTIKISKRPDTTRRVAPRASGSESSAEADQAIAEEIESEDLFHDEESK